LNVHALDLPSKEIRMAYLHILKGTNQGQKITLMGGTEFFLGRNTESHVVINDPAVSRVHARILLIQGKYFLEDGDGKNKSRNGTFVNTRLLEKERIALKNNDRIKICDFLCNFYEEDERKPLPKELRREEEEPEEADTSSTVEATLSHSSHQILESQPAEKLKFLLEITTQLAQTFDQNVLLPRVVEILFQFFKQADRGFIIIKEEGSDNKLIPMAIKTRRAHEETTARFSRTIVNKCIQTGQAFLSEDASADKKIDPSASIADARIRSVMCVPLLTRDTNQAFGVIQLDSQDRNKRFTPDDLKLLMAVASQAAVAMENAKLHDVLLARDRFQRDMELARQVQRSFLPKKLPEVQGYSFFAHYQAAQEVGGDYYDFIPLPQQGLAIMLGDVAGKGVPAALLMAKISSDARFSMLTETTPEVAVMELNAQLHQAGLSDRFVTLAAGLLDPTRHQMTFVNAGHLSPLIYRKATGTLEEVVPRELTGFPLGVVEDFSYDPCPVSLMPGDCILTFTDGVTDAKNKQDADFQMQGVYNALKEGPFTPQAMGARLVKAIEQHSLGCKQHDDITIVCFGRSASGR
jgi:serine phosphatase RsbU (regulator of sigma subunit)/pSer/pThr/pTyr-binding forkhead associated (FHA) protein